MHTDPEKSYRLNSLLVKRFRKFEELLLLLCCMKYLYFDHSIIEYLPLDDLNTAKCQQNNEKRNE